MTQSFLFLATHRCQTGKFDDRRRSNQRPGIQHRLRPVVTPILNPVLFAFFISFYYILFFFCGFSPCHTADRSPRDKETNQQHSLLVVVIYPLAIAGQILGAQLRQ
jgi:hypothetical protein